jgi:hypothetical protein
MSYKAIINKIGKQIVYLLNDFRDVVMKIPKDNEYFEVKAKDGSEWKVHNTTDLARETLLEGNEITEKEYSEYSLQRTKL